MTRLIFFKKEEKKRKKRVLVNKMLHFVRIWVVYCLHTETGMPDVAEVKP